MRCKSLLLAGLVCLIATSVAADDLYRVTVQSPADAEALRASGADPVVALRDGYLVLADQDALEKLQQSDLRLQFVVAGITRGELALDGRLDRDNVNRQELLFEAGNLRLYRIDPADAARLPEQQIFPVGERRPTVMFTGAPFLRMVPAEMIDLDSLITMVELDSLQSYVNRLQAFYRRVAGTDSNAVARDWIAGKLTSFGYDSVVIDSFVVSISGTPTDCQNVIAYKIGSRFPNHHVVIGAHRDAVPGSPGADDNGSGTAAVMELARVLQDVETDMTFVFVLFDAEEYGLHGAYHYADEAAARGDSIVYMLNMDMIAHYQNTNQAKLYHGSDLTFSVLWQDLADSLLGLTGSLQGEAANSDHYPFAAKGWPVTFVHEYIFSTVYHSYQDSTTYMNFTYFTKMAKASLATAYVVSQTAGPQPTLAFDYPIGIPTMLAPGVPTTFDVVVSGAWDGQPVPGSGMLHYAKSGSAYASIPMVEVSPNYYEATLPASSCDVRYSFYVSAEETTSGIIYDPAPTAPNMAVVADDSVTIFDDDFQTYQGWIVSGDATDGQWNRGVPVGGGDRGDPPTDFDGSGMCYLTDNVDGNSDVDNGTTMLRSPAIDVSAGNALVHYARWFSNSFGSSPFEDVMSVWVRNDDAAPWVLVEDVGPVDQATGGWYEHTFWVDDYVVPTANVSVLFTVPDTGLGSVVEAAVDDFQVTLFACTGYGFYITTDSLPDWTAGWPYSQQLQCSGGTGGRIWSDKYGDLAGTGLSLSSSGLLSGAATGQGLISFTAMVTDDLDSTAEKLFEFTINPAVSIVTDTLPDARADSAYAEQLLATGGTGVVSWSDPAGALLGTGLELTPDGMLTGTPLDSGTLAFTVRAEDQIGDWDELAYQIHIDPAFICGDVDGDSDEPNVADLSYLVEYLFLGGPPPPIMAAANVDGLSNMGNPVTVADLSYLVAYLFLDGPPPTCE